MTEAKPREEPAIVQYLRQRFLATQRGTVNAAPLAWEQVGELLDHLAHLDRLASGTGKRELPPRAGGEELAIEAVAAELWRLCARESAAFRSGQHAAIPAIRVALMMARDRRGGGR